MRIVAVIVLAAVLGSGCGDSGSVRSLKEELDRTQNQLATSKAQLSSLQSELATANAKIADLQPLVTKARTLPIRVTTTRSSADTNSVYQFLNLSGTALAVKIQLNNPTQKRSKSITCVLPAPRPALPYEIGSDGSWPVSTGDLLELSSEGYDVMKKAF